MRVSESPLGAAHTRERAGHAALQAVLDALTSLERAIDTDGLRAVS